MATSRPFSYNTGSTISGTEQIGDLAIGYPTVGFENTGLKWWNGPDEDLGYVIASSDPDGNHTGADGVQAFLGFHRSSEKTDNSFLQVSNYIAGGGQNFTQPYDAKVWLNNNGHWTSWTGSSPYDIYAVKMDYLIVGGGGSGGNGKYAGGGGSGQVITGNTLVEHGSGCTFSVVIGAGGTIVDLDTSTTGGLGNETYAFNKVTYGGGGGSQNMNTTGTGASSLGGGGGNMGRTNDLTRSGTTFCALGGSVLTNFTKDFEYDTCLYSLDYLNRIYEISCTNTGYGGGAGLVCTSSDTQAGGGGGGGFSSAGGDATHCFCFQKFDAIGGNGGNGLTWCDNITCVAGGGGGGVSEERTQNVAGLGSYGGGNGGKSTNGFSASANSGSGGGGAGYCGIGIDLYCGGNGGSGIVIFRYSGNTEIFSGGTVTCCNGYVYHCITSSCTINSII